MILVVGANGRVGRLVAEALLGHGERPRILVRDLAAATSRFGDRVEVAIGDLGDQAAVNMAMHSIEAVFLCSPVHPDQVVHQGNVVRAAERNRSYIVKLSGLATYDGSYVDSGAWHAATERQIREAGLNYTFLHPYFFMQNVQRQMAGARDSGVITSGIGYAPIAMVDTHDIADAAARLLLDNRIAPQQTLPLTGDAALTYAEVAQILTDLLGREVRYQTQSADDVERQLLASGMPAWHVNILMQFNRAFREGLGATTHPSVQNVLGRPPETLREALSRYTR